MIPLDKELLEAAANGTSSDIISLVQRGANVNVRDEDGLTPLHYVVEAGNKELALLLITLGASLECEDSRLRTPLHYAASECNQEIVDFLLVRGASVGARDVKGSTPLHCAMVFGDQGVVISLLKHGADVDAVDKEGLSVIHKSDNYCVESAFLTLVAYGGSSHRECLSHFDKFVGMSMRQAAVKAGLVDRLKDLVENEPSLLYKDLPSALLTMAIQSGQLEAAAFLQSHQAAMAIDVITKKAQLVRAV